MAWRCQHLRRTQHWTVNLSVEEKPVHEGQEHEKRFVQNEVSVLTCTVSFPEEIELILEDAEGTRDLVVDLDGPSDGRANDAMRLATGV
jgi:hypothetical protein